MFLAEIDIPPVAIYVLVAMVIAAIQKISEMAKAKGSDASDSAATELEDLYEDARREIIERQTTLQGPPELPVKNQPVTVIPQHRETAAPPPLPGWQKKVTKPKLSPAEKAALARFQAQSHRTKRRRQSTNSRVRRLLASPSAARDAIVLSEILGTPKSLQPNN